ncbi:MAG TPA: TonB-dependent receptor [Candidatus Baltobacteraceae bacterium]|nr:TonB-dependent receptor [Candidatus Baltobacteraceae bacterium]
MPQIRHRRFSHWCICLPLAGVLIAAEAQVPPTQPPVHLPPVTVMGATNGTSLTSPPISQAERIKREVPGGFTLQGIDSLEQGRASSLDDLLQNAPGVIMLSENEVDVSKIYIRGYGVIQEDEPSSVEYLIDGLTLNQADGEMIIEDLDVGTFKYAEIYSGADALQYGGLALGGAVNFVPFTGYDASPLAVKLEGGSFGFVRSELTTGGVDGKWDYYVSISARYRDGWRDHSTESTEYFFSDLGYKFNNRLENRVYAIVDQTDREVPGALTLQQMEQNPAQADSLAVPQDWRKDWYYFRLADKLSYKAGGEEADAGVYWWHREAYEPNIYIPSNTLSGIGSFYADDFGGLFNSTTRWDWLGGENILTLGFNPTAENEEDAYYENLNGQKGALTGADGEWSLNGVLYAQLQHYLTEKFSIVLGVQGIYAQRHFSDFFNTSVDGNVSRNLIYRGIDPKVGLIYELNDKDQLFANFSGAEQPPSFDDMVSFDTGPNTSQVLTPLEMQTAWTAEVGTRGKSDRAEWELALYHAWVRHELVDVYSGESDLDLGSLNVPHSMHQGVEAGLDYQLFESMFTQGNKTRAGDRLTLRQDFTLTDAHFSHDPTFGNDRIAGIPIYDYQAQLMYESPYGFYAGPNLHWIMTRFPVDNANTLYAPAYVLLGFRAGARLWKNLSVFVDAHNLLDQRYASSVDPISSASAFEPQVQVFHPGDPRSFYGGVSWKW